MRRASGESGRGRLVAPVPAGDNGPYANAQCGPKAFNPSPRHFVRPIARPSRALSKKRCNPLTSLWRRRESNPQSSPKQTLCLQPLARASARSHAGIVSETCRPIPPRTVQFHVGLRAMRNVLGQFNRWHFRSRCRSRRGSARAQPPFANRARPPPTERGPRPRQTTTARHFPCGAPSWPSVQTALTESLPSAGRCAEHWLRLRSTPRQPLQPSSRVTGPRRR